MRVASKNPHVGHKRPDLTDEPVRFWPIRGQYFVIYLPDTEPLKIVRILHGARDASAIAIDRAETKARTRELSVRFIQGDALRLAALAETFDTVTDSGLLHVFSDPDMELLIRGVHAVLCPAKGSKEHEMQAHHEIEETIDEYLAQVSIDDKQPLFQSVNKAGTALTKPAAR